MTLSAKTFEELANHTRASTATYVGSDGLIKTAAVDEPRFDYDFENGVSLGFLSEKPVTNIMLFSEDFTQGWTLNGGTVVTSNTTVAPDGTLTADTLTYDQREGPDRLVQSRPITPGVSQTGSIFVKSIDAEYFTVRMIQSGGAIVLDERVTFEFATETFSVGSGGTYLLDYGFRKLANGWYRLFITCSTFADGGSINFSFGGSAEAPPPASIVDVAVWGAQVEDRLRPTSYIKTEAVATGRSGDTFKADLPPWFNQKQGTFLIKVQGGLPEDFNRVFGVRSDTHPQLRISVNTSDSGSLSFAYVDKNGVISNVTIAPPGSIPLDQSVVLVCRYNTIDMELAVVNADTGLLVSNAISSIEGSEDNFDSLGLLNTPGFGSASTFGGTMSIFEYRPVALSDSEMLELYAENAS